MQRGELRLSQYVTVRAHAFLSSDQTNVFTDTAVSYGNSAAAVFCHLVSVSIVAAFLALRNISVPFLTLV